ncbi:MAG TPA: LysE family translocator [Pseudolysinimonas sp.]|nr:LysE family translocator [Pseudolysinimonas sp.]
MTVALLAAVGALALLTLLPGPDFAIVARWAGTAGFRSGVLAALGVVTGCTIWGALTVAGLAALFTASPTAYEVVRVVGAGYLVWMAARLIGRSLRRAGGEVADVGVVASGRVAYRQGLVTNLLNPKIAAFYVGVLPVLVPTGAPHALTMAALVLIHQVLGIVWLTLVSLAISRGRSVLSRPGARRWLDRITGVVLLGFAGRLALDAA